MILKNWLLRCVALEQPDISTRPMPAETSCERSIPSREVAPVFPSDTTIPTGSPTEKKHKDQGMLRAVTDRVRAHATAVDLFLCSAEPFSRCVNRSHA